MTRPRIYTERRVSTAVRIPVSLHERLHAEAAARQVSANLLIEKALVDYLARLPALDDQVRVGP